jgi:hypothetical protein
MGQELVTPDGDTSVNLMDAGSGAFLVGVRTRVEADWALVTVFYREQWGSRELPQELLLSSESMAPVAGWKIHGATHNSFAIPRDRIQFIRVLFLNEAGKREVKPP